MSASGRSQPRRRARALLLGAAAALLATFWLGCSRHAENRPEHHHAEVRGHADEAEHAGHGHDEPGDVPPDSERQSDVGPVPAGGEQSSVQAERGERRVAVSPEAVARSGIVVARVATLAAGGGIEVPAEVQAEPDRVAHVSPIVAGQLAKVTAKVGDHVKAGQPLAVVRSVALGEARAQAARALANVEVAEANLRRQQELQREGIGAERQFIEAQAEFKRAQAELSAADRALEVYGRGGSGSEVTINSPIAGRVVTRHATVGEVVSPSDTLFEITDIARVWVVGRVYQQHAGRVSEGANVQLSVRALPERTFSGKLDYVAPALDERTHTLPVRVVLDNPDGALRPGLFGTLIISADVTQEPSAAVSVNALQRLGEQTVVFVPADVAGQFRAVPVVAGARTGDVVRIVSGLKVGDAYVADGAFVLKSELRRSELGEGHAH